MEPTCSVEGCDRDTYSRGFCEMHYRRVLRTGDPGPAGPATVRSRCEAPGCEEPVDAKGLCHGHYQRLLRTGDRDLSPLRKEARKCSVGGCDRPHKAHGLCATHYTRQRRRGNPSAERPVKEQGLGWYQDGYFNISLPPQLRHLVGGAKSTGEHRLVMALHLGRPLKPDESPSHQWSARRQQDREFGALVFVSPKRSPRRRPRRMGAQVMFDRYYEEEWSGESTW